MANNEAVKSRRETHIERLRKKHPEKQFENDEEIFGQINDDYDEYDTRLGEYADREKSIVDMFDADPRSAQMIADMHNGKDPIVSLLSRYGSEYKEMLDDPDFIEKLAKEHQEEMERVAKNRKLEDEYAANLDKTIEMLLSFQQERGLSDVEIDNTMAVLLGIVKDGMMGKFLPSTVDMILKAINHDADVATAAEEGEVAGRNAKITEQLRKSKKGDGLAPLNGKSNRPEATRRGKTMFDLAGEAM